MPNYNLVVEHKSSAYGEFELLIEKTVRRESTGSGTLLGTGIRDLSFGFKQKPAAEAAQARVLALGKEHHKWIRTHLYPA